MSARRGPRAASHRALALFCLLALSADFWRPCFFTAALQGAAHSARSLRGQACSLRGKGCGVSLVSEAMMPSFTARTSGPLRSRITAGALSAPEKLVKLVREFPENYDNDDMYDFMSDFKKLRDKIDGYDASSFERLKGLWRLEFNSKSGLGFPKKASTISLKGLAAELPDIQVSSVGKYLKLSEGSYQMILPFTLPEAGREAAVVLSGSWFGGKPVPAPGASVPDRTRVTSEFNSLSIVLASDDDSAMIESAGLSDFLSPMEIQRAPQFNDLDYANEELFAQTSQAGVLEVYTSVDAVPFTLGS
eukprot:TRINITY_DN107375_c0_g1_i1.p1 TRINITY_DN107375_c0_g1~~TRINITY_DN107375_c0_g1_i1.p1  ORF type:complete len:305 (-),score=52.55 TRINITY_DN107375_c0_g1_i1:25-939(-)